MDENMIRGTELHADDKRDVLARFVNRFTMERRPAWAQGTLYRPQFRDDQDWLANTLFRVRRDGRLDQRFRGCQSTPTWPLGKGCAEAGRHLPDCEHDTPMDKATAVERFRALVARYGLQWTAAVPAEAHAELRRVNEVLTEADRRAALGLRS